METTNYLMNSYKRFPVTFTRGEGALLFDANNKAYIDFLAGIAVVSCGHANPKIARATYDQALKLGHVSNLYWTEPGVELSRRLHELVGGWGKVFLCNSGTEAIEAGIKLVRKWGNPKRYKILCANGGFHGRTLGALAATGQPAKWDGFQPLPAGFVHCEYNCLESFKAALDGECAAILLETIQGENGVIPATPEFLKGIRELCTKEHIALMFDEIQTGIGRTGNWWSFQGYGVKPDILLAAKGLGSGFPIGACIADLPWADVFQPGQHGTTFGGNPVAAATALAVLDFLQSEDILTHVKKIGAILKQSLSKLQGVSFVRGEGLMLGIGLIKNKAAEVTKRALELGVVVINTSDSVLRIVPPLVLSEEQALQGSELLGKAILEEFAK